MLFMATQIHAPEHCPAAGTSQQPLYDNNNEQVVVRAIYACPPAHILYFILEATEMQDVLEFFAPGLARTNVDIKPVIES